MPILVIQHERFEHLGYFAAVFEQHGIACSIRNLGDPLSLDGCTGVVVMGGPMSANDPLPGLLNELRLIDQALKAAVPLLGVCLGSQLMAKALGARVYRNAEPEIGWAPVHLTEAGLQDPLFTGIPSPSTFFHWHSETFDLPAGAEWLAYSDKCRHQAYRYKHNVYGLQFHPEITADMIADWCSQPVNCADVESLQDPIDAHAADPGPMARQILKLWLDLF